MARRIMLAVMALIVALLGIIAVPLGLITAGQDRRDFHSETLTAAATLANVAEERLGDRSHGLALARVIAGLARSGDQLSVYDNAGIRQGGTAAFPVLSSRLVHHVVADAAPVLYPAEDRLIVVAPVFREDGHAAIGAVMLSRSSGELDHRLAVLWTWLGAVSAAGLLAAVLVSVALARWVGRPLAELQ